MKFNKTTLPNGLRIITMPMTDNPSVTVLVMVETGSKYETKEINGISHFLEHMMFKGTARRPSAIDISRELDGLGANYNAFTGQEYTGYYAKVSSDRFDQALDIISDLYVNPVFKTEDMEKEKGVIVEEIRMYQDLPQRDVQDVFTELLHGDQPAGWSVTGTEESVRSYTKEQLVNYRTDHYVSSATSVIVAGSMDEKSVIEKIKTAFANVSTSDNKPKLLVHEAQSAPALRLKYKETDQTHLVVGFRSFSILDKRMPAIQVLSTILGGGMSSRLFEKLRTGMGICYYVRSSQNPNTDHGDFTVSAGVDSSRVHEALKEILKQFVTLKDELVSETELKKAKDYITGTTLLELETSEARAEYVGYQEMLKHSVELPEEILGRINNVTSADIQALAQDLFVDARLNLAIVGKYKEESAFEEYLTVGK